MAANSSKAETNSKDDIRQPTPCSATRVARFGYLPQSRIFDRGRKPMDVRLDGRTAIITGSSKGLGLAMAKEFAASGAHVAILARNPEGLAEAGATVSEGASGKAATFQCDVSKAADISNTFQAVITPFCAGDVLSTNA